MSTPTPRPSDTIANRFGSLLASHTLRDLNADLVWPIIHRQILHEQLYPVLEAIGSQIVHPALMDGLAQKYNISPVIEAHDPLYVAARRFAQARLVQAILPELQDPSLLKDETAFTNKIKEIAEGLSTASKEEMLDAIGDIAGNGDVIAATGSLQLIAPRHRPRPAKTPIHDYLLDTMISITARHSGTIEYIIHLKKLKPEDLTPAGAPKLGFMEEVEKMTTQFLDPSMEITSSTESHNPSECTIQLGIALKEDRRIRPGHLILEAGEAIEEALQAHKAKASKTR